MGLHQREQYEVFAALEAYHGETPGAESAVRMELRRRAETLNDLVRATVWLELAEGVAPKLREYDTAAEELGLATRNEVISAWNKWTFATRALLGEWTPETPSQRALRKATSGRKRSHVRATASLGPSATA
jgi:hypothetical protein